MLELLLLFVLGVFSAPITEQLQRECNLVREAYLAVRPSWSTTTIPEDCRNWSEIVTDDYSIRTIKFYYFNGKTFPNQLLELKNVTRVDITNVGFEGVFPSNMSWPLLETFTFTRSGSGTFGPLPSALFVPSLKEIVVSKIDGVPDSIKDSNISSIYFKSCSVNGIFSKLPVTLKTFDCNLCKLQVMDGIERLTNLSSLNLPGNNIKTIPNLKDLASLSVLKLERNAITVIPDETAALKSLTVLDLSENPIIAIPDSLGTSTSIKELKLESTNINTIPASLSRLATLESLSIRDAPLNEAIFATTPGGYPKLSRCSLDRDIFCSSESTPAPKACSLKPCPSQNIQQECQLARDAFLKISRSEVFLPSKIFCCSNYLITCADDHITEIKWTDTYSDPNVLFPSELTKLPYLSVLNLENHQLTGPLPADLSNWKNMTYLNLRARPCSFCDSEGNRVRKLNGTLPASLFTEKLKYLSLEENNFEGTFPNTLSSTTSLTDLNMKANYRLKGPVLKTLVEFPNLTTLELSKVVLNETIPDIDSKWTKLKTLDLSETKLYGTVPESLGNLPNLTLLYLGRNALQGGFTNKQNQWSKLQVCSLYNSGLCIAPSGLPEACDGSLDSNYCSNPAIDAQCATVSSWYEASEQVSPIPKSDCCSSYEVTCSATGIIKLDLGKYPARISVIPEFTTAFPELTEVRMFRSNIANFPKSFFGLPLKRINLDRLLLNNTKLVEFAQFKALESLRIFGTQMGGALPRSIANLDQLQELDLSTNRFVGDIPEEYGNLVSLTSFSVRANQNVTGTLPPDFHRLKNLTSINLSGTRMSGPFANPRASPGFTALKECSLSETKLCFDEEFVIPELCQWNYQCPSSTLEEQCKLVSEAFKETSSNSEFPASNCCFDRRVKCVDNKIVELSLNGIRGNLSPKFGQLTDLEVFNVFSSYSLQGDVGVLFQSKKLRSITVNQSGLNGTLPGTLSQLPNLEKISIIGSNIGGSIPEDISSLQNLTLINLQSNYFTGRVPQTITQLTKLQSLTLVGEGFEGELPDLSRLPALETLALVSSKFTGVLINPTNDRGFKALSYCDLRGSKICSNSDNFMPSMCNWNFQCPDDRLKQQCGIARTIWTEMGGKQESAPDLVNCCFDKRFICEGNNITALDWSRQILDQTIPSKIVELTSLKDLDLSYNKINGTIPKEISLLGNLELLGLSGNRLTGTIPDLSTLKNLTSLYVGGNPDLTGTLINQGTNNFAKLRFCELGGTICADDQNKIPAVCRWNYFCPTESVNSQCKVLGQAYSKMTGSDWQRPTEKCCFQSNIQCTRDDIISVDFSFSRLKGSIANEIFELKKLKSLDLKSNELTGPIPSEITSLGSLEKLILSKNQFNGTLPDLSSLKNLKILDVSENRLIGAVQLPNLEQCSLEKNLVCQPQDRAVPASCGPIVQCPSGRLASQCKMVQSIYKAMGGNNIPDEAYCCSDPRLKCNNEDITDISFTNDGLRGSLPDDLQLLPGLTNLTIEAFRFEASFSLFTKLPSLKQIQLDGVKLGGQIEDLLPIAKRLEVLKISDSNITFSLDAVAPFTNLRVLNLKSNSGLNGTIGRAFDQMKKLEVLDLSYTALTGKLPTSLGRLPELKVLVLTSAKFLYGRFPSLRNNPGFSKLTTCSLTFTRLCDDDFYAAPVACRSYLKCPNEELEPQCELVHQTFTKLGGSASIRNENCCNLEESFVGCSGNAITLVNWDRRSSFLTLRGTIPNDFFEQLPEMVSFSATGNALSGPIPEGIKSWTKLETLNLKANLFKGPVPEFLASLPKLKSLDLSENDGLTGALPVGFSTLQQCALPKNVCSNGTVPAVCPAVRAC